MVCVREYIKVFVWIAGCDFDMLMCVQMCASVICGWCVVWYVCVVAWGSGNVMEACEFVVRR